MIHILIFLISFMLTSILWNWKKICKFLELDKSYVVNFNFSNNITSKLTETRRSIPFKFLNNYLVKFGIIILIASFNILTLF